jgi:hypothetical protein
MKRSRRCCGPFVGSAGDNWVRSNEEPSMSASRPLSSNAYVQVDGEDAFTGWPPLSAVFA